MKRRVRTWLSLKNGYDKAALEFSRVGILIGVDRTAFSFSVVFYGAGPLQSK